MRIQYKSHPQVPYRCICRKELKYRARIKFYYGLWQIQEGCGNTKEEAKADLINNINSLPQEMRKVIPLT